MAEVGSPFENVGSTRQKGGSNWAMFEDQY